MAKSEFATEWMRKVRLGVEYRKKYGRDHEWPEYMKMYRSDWDEGILPVNKMFSYIRGMIPRIYFNAPRVSITPTRPELVWHAKVVEAIDNMLIREMFLKDTFKMSILDALLCGVGPIKLGYDSEFGFDPDLVVMPDGTTATQFSTKSGDKVEYKSYIKPGTPWALRAHPSTVIVPWGACDPRSLPWIAHYIIRPLEDVMVDQKYNDNRSQIKGTRSPEYLATIQSEQDRRQGDKEDTYVELFEVRDFKTGKVFVFCEDMVLLDTEDVLQIEELPYEFIIFNRDPEYFWAIPDARILRPRQDELNEVKTQIKRHRQILLLKFLARKGAIDQTEIDKFLSGEVGPFVFLNENVDSIGLAIQEFKPSMPTELYNEAQTILQDIREELGFGTNQGAQLAPGTPPTATETKVVEQAFNLRVDERRDIVADVLVNIVRKWNQYIFRFWSEERVIRIVTPQGQPAWIKYTGEELTGDYFLHIDPDTGVPMTQMLKYQMAKEMFATFNGDQLMDQILLRKMLVGHYSSVDPQADQLVQTPPSVMMGETTPDELAAMRQPNPQMMGSKGPGGSIGKPTQPMQLSELGRTPSQ